MSNPIEDYINGLEGRQDVDPLAIARDLRELHVREIGTREAKIEQLNTTIAEKDGDIAKATTELQKQKAANFDLAMQIPGTDAKPSNHPADDERRSGSEIRVTDLFSDRVRKSNPNLRKTI